MNSATIYSSVAMLLFLLLNTAIESIEGSVIYYAKADLDDKHRKLVSFKVYEETDDYDYLKKELTCFTCDKSHSNEECNRKAIDEPCVSSKLISADQLRESAKSLANSINSNTLESGPSLTHHHEQYDMVPATAACLTIHKFNSLTLKTISVEKKCARDCQADMVGCSSPILHSHKSDTVKTHQYIRTCTYCCNKNYCNFDIASSSVQAFNLTQDALFKSNASSRQVPTPFAPLFFLFSVVISLIRL